MPRFLIRLRPRGQEQLIADEDPGDFWRKIYSFLETENAFDFSKHQTEVHSESVQNLHDCLAKLIRTDPDREDWCPMAFDSWTCWNATPPDEDLAVNCPKVLGYNVFNHAYRYCEPNGTWLMSSTSNKSWSDYSECVDMSEGLFHRGIVIFSIIGTILSLLALVTALCIFQSLGSLNCGRIQIHKSLFVALTLTNILWLRWYFETLFQPSIGSENPIWCRILHVVMMYFTVSSYTWVLCEGLYLQLMLTTRGQLNETKFKIGLFIFGWFSPVFILVPYTLFRQSIPEEDLNCWMDFGSSQWFLSIPVGLILLANVCILINVIIVLRKKLKAGGSHLVRINSNPAVTLKSAKAAFLLIPILGLQFLVLPVRPEEHSPLSRLYDVISAFLSSYQGVIISLLFCFLNGEVSKALSRKWMHFKLGPHSRVFSQVENAGLYFRDLSFEPRRRRRSDPNLTKLLNSSGKHSDERCECNRANVDHVMRCSIITSSSFLRPSNALFTGTVGRKDAIPVN
ncbi:corticotropin-releasing factor receptor 2-like isoform X2 [Tigriopus californicus]|uniref:corticotropin-releasing factor receptor 2-like isoform X2 n=1 Tax=Tigriopus californicus TaxID=6832 RepID=UPI0027D9D425|nr:corticotropin-releasing factor receptor 2-like isoform X2 [Tigriopus californicus]